MALHTAPATYTPGALGDAAFGRHTKSFQVSSSRYVLLPYSKSGNAYILHDHVTDLVLVRLYRSRTGVCIRQPLAVLHADCQARMVHVLASGVFLSGFIKDMWCLPRPLSPPLNRISMSHSAALEYGFPSTHSTNAVSVAVYSLFILNSPDSNVNTSLKVLLQIAACCYAISIILGRLYCGMHGFFDVLVGSALGASLSITQYMFGDAFDAFILTNSWKPLAIVALIIAVLIRIHPEPADDCPCFDDSVAFAGVMVGVELGNWHFGQSKYAWSEPAFATVPYRLDALGWPFSVARIVMGVVVIFVWRAVMKAILLKALPPVFRIIERLGLSLPRRFFVQAS